MTPQEEFSEALAAQREEWSEQKAILQEQVQIGREISRSIKKLADRIDAMDRRAGH